ncbi:MAG: glycoside hydrolase [Pseudomonadota bacterium]
MSAEQPVKVVLCWHMHQPSYVDPRTNEYQLPWTYLHAIKDYVDMVAHLEANPDARAVVNFSPTLIEQVEDYARQIAGHLRDGSPLHDPLLRALVDPMPPREIEQRQQLVRQCLRANEKHLITPHTPFKRLVELGRWLDRHPEHEHYLSDAFLTDLLTWYHLAWLGETVRREDRRARKLIQKASGFTAHDRRELVVLIGELLSGVLGRYRRLAEEGRIELSVTPYAHPILPLLQDLESAREGWPQSSLPELDHYPGGDQRAHWHVEHGLEVFERVFGFRPAGCWPAEGGVSEPTLAVLEEHGFRWAATGGCVLDHSLRAGGQSVESDPEWHRPFVVKGGGIRCFFRDDGLSDLIGFSYSDWHGDDAVANLVGHLESIADYCSDREKAVISIILDGENAWEHYPHNGYHFLSALYRRLAEHPGLQPTTFEEACEVKPRELNQLVAGSWVYGTFSTWIGERDKDRAWDLLGEAKRAFDAHIDQLDSVARERAEHQLAICESSDWFWWFGEYNPDDTVKDFDHLYRLQLIALYERLGLEPPEVLGQPFAHGSGEPAVGGVMRQGRADS